MVDFETITGSAISFLNTSISSFQHSISTMTSGNQTVLISLATIIIVAAIFALILKLLKQELIPAYILAGLVIGPLVLGLVKNSSLITALAEIGIAFLLFVAGLEISSQKLKETSYAFIAGLFQIIIIGFATFFISIGFGFTRLEALYLALILAFSSTIIVVKLLADKRELNTLHARIAISILVLQDFIAIIALAILSSSASQYTGSFMIIALVKLVLIVLIAWFLNKTILNSIFKFASSSTELLFLVSIAFVFLFAALAYFLNLSIVIGAFIAGVALANLPYKVEIESKIKPLRDFFVIIFFVSLGTWLTSFNINKDVLVFIIFLALVVIAKPFITAFIIRMFGYKTRTSILSGLAIGQVSEFSLILALQGLLLGILSQTTFNIIVLVAIITMALTPYLIKSSAFIHSKSASLFSFMDNMPVHREIIGHKTDTKKTIILFGCHRMGSIFLKTLGKMKENILVVDYDPEIIRALTKQDIACIYGDTGSADVIEALQLKHVNVAISTIPDIHSNSLLIKKLKLLNPDIFVLVTAEKIHDALRLYEVGADYVILPHVISGEKSLELIKDVEKFSSNKGKFRKTREEHIKHLEELHRFLY